MALNYSLLVEKFTTITTNTNINWSDGFNVSHFDDTYKEQYTKIKLYSDTGTFSLAKETECCILVVGGGGSGACGTNGGGGGGGGGVSYYDSIILPADTYNLIVGAGGSSVSGSSDGNDGTNSSFIGRKTSPQISITSTGGEGGKGLRGGNSGSGKLRDYNGIVTNNVAHSAFIPSSNNPYIANKLGFGGGGAYASSPNIISGSYIGGNGGKGYSVHNTYDGTRKIYGAGGGGSSISGTSGPGGDGESNNDGTSNGAGNGAGNNTSVSNALANTGGGGGGGITTSGAGGSGIIIIFFKTSNINTLKPTLSSFVRRNVPQSSNSSKKQSCVKDKDCEYIGCGQNEIGATSHCEYETCYKQNLQGKLILCPKHGDDTDDDGKGYQYGYYDDPDYDYGYGVDATAAATTTTTTKKHNLSFKNDIVDSSTTDDKKMSTIGIIVMVLIIILIILWVIAGLCGFIMSLICFSKEGDFIFNILGLILALLVGPFYWIFYAYNKKYCN